MYWLKSPIAGVDADFDFCQTYIKDLFNDQKLETWLKDQVDCRLRLGNSLLPFVFSIVSRFILVKDE